MRTSRRLVPGRKASNFLPFRRNYRPHLELLEDRTVPAPVFWNVDAGGNWNTPSNWSTGTVPGAGDDVYIDRPAGNYTITYSSGTSSVNSIHCTEILTISGGELSITATSDVSNLALTNATLGGTGDLSIGGSFDWNNYGVLATTGTTTASAGANVTIDAAYYAVLQFGQFINQGSATWLAGTFYLEDGASFTNQNLFEIRGNDTLQPYGAEPNTFINEGTFRKHIGTGTGTLNTVFNNTGTVDAQDGNTLFQGDGTNSGVYAVSSGATLTVNSTLEFADGAGVTGPGDFYVTGIVDITAASVTVERLILTGSIEGSGDLTITSAFDWGNYGTLATTGTTTLPASCTTNLDAAYHVVLKKGTLVNQGTLNWINGTFYIEEVGTFRNQNVFDAQSDQLMEPYGAGPNIFLNEATFQKSAGGISETQIRVILQNTGAINVQAGTLWLSGDGINGGVIDVPDGACLAFGEALSVFTHDAASTVSGAGTLKFRAGTTNFLGTFSFTGLTSIEGGTADFSTGGAVSFPNLAVSNGFLQGTDDQLVTGTFDWMNYGELLGPGLTTIYPGATVTINAAYQIELNNRTLVNNGTVTWELGSFYIEYGASVDNQSLFEIHNNDWLLPYGSGPNVFTNYGMVRKSTGVDPTRVSVQFDNLGTVQVDTGALSLEGDGASSGPISIADAAELRIWNDYTLEAGGDIGGPGVLEIHGTLIAAADVSLENVYLPGTLSGAGDVTITEELLWGNYGIMTGAGMKIIAPGAVLTIDAVYHVELINTTVINAGTTQWHQGILYIEYGGTFVNQAGALFDAHANDSILPWATGPNTFSNLGTFRNSSGQTPVSVAFNNFALVDIAAGSMSFTGGGTSTGDFIGVIGTALTFGGSHNLSPTASVAGMDAVTVSTGTNVFEGPITAASITVNGGTNTLGGTITAATFAIAGGMTTIAGIYQISGVTQIHFGIADFSGAGEVTIGTLNLSYNGTLTGNRDITVTGLVTWDRDAQIEGTGAFTFAASAAVTLNESGNYFVEIIGRNVTNAGTMIFTHGTFYIEEGATFTNTGTFEIRTQYYSYFFPYGAGPNTFANEGTLLAETTGASNYFCRMDVQFINTGFVHILQNKLSFQGGGANTGQFLIDAAGTLDFSFNDFDLSGGIIHGPGWVQFVGVGSAAVPQVIEVPSRDRGNVGIGFENNFAIGTLYLSNSFIKLVDTGDNSGGSGPEAWYLNTIQVVGGRAFLKFDMNNLNLYARQVNLAGYDVLNGTINIVPDGGPMTLNNPTPGAIAVVNEVDDWTFFGRAEQTFSFQVNSGSTGLYPPLSPTLNFAKVTVLDPDGNAIATGSSSVAGEIVTLLGVTLPEDGVYHILIEAADSNPTNTGNYTFAIWTATVDEHYLFVNRVTNGLLESPFSLDRWTFAANANDQVEFDWINASSSAIRFQISGPNGWTGFTDIGADSGAITLPESGDYVVEAYVVNGEPGPYAFRLLQTGLIDLTLGESYIGAFMGSGHAQLYRVAVPEADSLRVVLDDTAGDHLNEVYVKFGAPPTRSDYDYRFETPAAADQEVFIPNAASGNWYILAYGDHVPTASTYSLVATTSPLYLRHAIPERQGTNANLVLTLTGSGFNASTTVTLVATGGAEFSAGQIAINLPTQITATFAANSLPPGVYDVYVSKPGGGSAEIPDAVQIVAGGRAELRTEIILPEVVGRHALATLYVEYWNAGDISMPAPLLVFRGTDRALLSLDSNRITEGFWTTAEPLGYRDTIYISGAGATPGVLHAGERVRVPIYFAGLLGPWDMNDSSVNFSVSSLTTENTALIDWNNMQELLRPPDVGTVAWNVIFNNLKTQIGTTWGQYVATLNENAAYLGSLGQHVVDVGELYTFELRQAIGLHPLPRLDATVDAQNPAPGMDLTFSRSFNASLEGRYRMGPLGRGWTASWDVSLSERTDGTVIITGGDGAKRIFQPDSRGGYFASPGDHAELINNATFAVRELNGVTTHFTSDGALDFIEDPNGNRITAGYESGRLTSLTHTAGFDLQFTYNTAGRIATLTDTVGRVTRYQYDAANEHLLSVEDPYGQFTRYTYGTGADTQLHALTEIEFPMNQREFYGYDGQGRLQSLARNGNAERLTFAYNATGQVTVTNAAGTSVVLYYDHRGLPGKIADMLGNATHLTFDHDYQLSSLTNTEGFRYQINRDDVGNITRIVNPLGQRLSFDYGTAFNRLTKFTDARGNAMRYAYDANGNLRSITYADDTRDQFGFDSDGNVTSWTNRAGQPVTLTYDAAGRITSKRYPDGSQWTYGYDAKGNLQTATDSSGNITALYDASERVTRVTYPDGKFLEYEYDDADRRTRVTDQGGFVVNYHYDAVGRLDHLTNPGGTTLVDYVYDNAGRLVGRNNENGTHTTYEYHPAGDVWKITNFAPDNSVQSRFEYGYDSLHRRVSMTTIDGAWLYQYDETNQLTRAVFTSNSPGVIPHQDLQYEYDSAGNRIRTIMNGVETLYTTNNLNQYTIVGTATYAYDANGNLISTVDGARTETFTYNVENRLTGVTMPEGTWTYEYDALGNRRAIIENGQRTDFVHDPFGLGNVFAEYDAAGLVAHYVQALGLVSRVDATGDAAYYGYDLLGSVSEVTGTTGAILNRYVYEPFGGKLFEQASVANPFQFVGSWGVMDDAGALQYMRMRSYDSNTGRFLSADPLNLTAGDGNLYRYGVNNPLFFIDPLGLKPGLGGGAGDPIRSGVGDIAGSLGINDPIIQKGIGGAVLGSTIGASLVIAGKVIFPQVAFPAAIAIGIVTGANAGFDEAVIESIFVDPVIDGIIDCVIDRDKLVDDIKAAMEGYYDPDGILDWRYPPWDPRAWPQAPGDNGAEGDSDSVGSADPNEKTGPGGYGAARFVAADATLPYRIDFENDAEATAPAQRVVVTDPLDSNFDWNSFSFTEVGFGDVIIPIPTGSRYFETVVSMTYNGKTFDVFIELGIRAATGEVYAIIQSIDPNTSLPPDVLTGFLPPEDGTGRGMGYFSFFIKPKPALPTGTRIRNIAYITFDANQSIATNQIDPHDPSLGTDPEKEAYVTIDYGKPSSSVSALPATVSSPSFSVTWSGNDDAGGSQIRWYDIWVSTDGGQFVPWLMHTLLTTATFEGEINRHYAFYSVATDNVGNVEDPPPGSDTSTDVPDLPTVQFVTVSSTGVEGKTLKLALTLSRPAADFTSIDYVVVSGSAGAADYRTPVGTVTFKPGQTTRKVSFKTTNDRTDEPDEALQIGLGNASHLAIGAARIYDYTILDNDKPPKVQFALKTSSVNEAAGTVDVIVSLAVASAFPVTVNYSVIGGTALGNGVDFTLPPGTLTFQPSETSKAITIPLANDPSVEDIETIDLLLSDPVNALLGKRFSHLLSIVDND